MPFILNCSHAIQYLADRTNFTYQAVEAIASYHIDTHSQQEVDPTQLSGDWTEADTLSRLVADYKHVDGFPTDIHDDDAIIEWFKEKTVFIPFQYATSTHYVLLNF